MEILIRKISVVEMKHSLNGYFPGTIVSGSRTKGIGKLTPASDSYFLGYPVRCSADFSLDSHEISAQQLSTESVKTVGKPEG